MCSLIDPVAGFAIPQKWLTRSGFSLPELKRRIDSGLYMLTASGTLLKRGLTTGTISAAAAKASVLSIAEPTTQVDILTPIGIRVKVHTTSADGWASAQKPGSDHSKDVTEGLIFEAEASKAVGIQLSPGEGIGIVKKRGLRAPYGTPAISPEARWSIENAIGEATRSIGLKGALVKLSAINGAAISKKTLNEKVGVFGGVSVLGTTGFVEPWNECLVGSAENLAETADRVALTTGRTGFKYAKMYFPDHTTLIAGSNLERVFQKAEGKETIIIGLPALILKWAKPDILNEMKADTVQELFDRDPYAEEITVALTALKTRTKARIVIIDRAGKIIRDIG